MKIKSYLVNLKESTARKERTLQEISGYSLLDVEVVEAINGKNLSEEELDLLFDRERFIRKYSRKPAAGEIGCTLSHRECYRRLLDSDNEYALILEDDVCFIYPDDVEFILKRAVGILSADKSCIITLSRYHCYYPKVLHSLSGYSFYRIWGAYGTCAYLINRCAAKKLLSIDKPFLVADDFEYMHLSGIYIQGISPFLALDASTMQSISSEIMDRDKKDNIKIPFKYRLKNMILTKVRVGLIKLNILKLKAQINLNTR